MSAIGSLHVRGPSSMDACHVMLVDDLSLLLRSQIFCLRQNYLYYFFAFNVYCRRVSVFDLSCFSVLDLYAFERPLLALLVSETFYSLFPYMDIYRTGPV